MDGLDDVKNLVTGLLGHMLGGLLTLTFLGRACMQEAAYGCLEQSSAAEHHHFGDLLRPVPPIPLKLSHSLLAV